MRIVIYGAFTCPNSFLASVRVDRLTANGALKADWRAVESGRPPITGSRAADRRDDPARELTQAREVALPGAVTVYGGPLTTAGSRRARRWCQEWLALPRRVTPALLAPDATVMLGEDATVMLGEDATVMLGEDALRYLSGRSILTGLG